MRLQKAQEDVQDAMDMALLKNNLYSTNILPEEADQLVQVAQRMVLRRQKSLNDMRELVSAGVLSRAEAEASGTSLDRAQQELDLAESRAKLVQQMAESARIQKAMASLEVEAPQHPDWDGKVYTHYAGNGVFTPAELHSLEVAYLTRFAKPMPISAEGETALHRSFGFDHRGRVDVAVNPDQPEGVWLMRYLESKRIPYFAFRAAVPHKATGPHIHVGPESTRLALLPTSSFSVINSPLPDEGELDCRKLSNSAPVHSSGVVATIREALAGSRRDLTEGNLKRAIVILAIPMILEMLMESLFGIV